jgi:hypothetical protein
MINPLRDQAIFRNPLEYEVIFDVTRSTYDWWWFGAPVAFALMIALGIWQRRILIPSDQRKSIHWYDQITSQSGRTLRKVNLPCYVAALVIISCSFSVAFIVTGFNRSYAQILVNEDKARVVEGPVENFEAITRTRTTSILNIDTFTVQGVRFRFTGASHSIGYHRVSAHGGVINRNGLYVRIHYAHITGDPVDPTILKLEVRKVSQ